ncbi:MAG: endonuclease/exonuclease/phosphatase family protein [Deltaproteobacteria bacterium]|nr:endonuclease/exonuclease/phosphatase family protein [Deltaproteobacteria bacterium]
MVTISEYLLTHRLRDYLDELAHFSSTRRLKKSLVYRGLKDEIERVAGGIEHGFYSPPGRPQKKPFYRIVAWNIERGLEFNGILQTLKHHPELSKGDIFLFSETDIGMARTQNLNVARELALVLGMNYFFAPSYLNLCKGNSVEDHIEGENALGLHGNAILSRYPMENLRIVPLKNCKDKMKGKEKRIGCQKSLVAEVDFPFKKVTVACVHLDAHSSQRQRGAQIKTVLDSLQGNPHPVLLGGDLNTSSYNARHAFFAFCGFWFKVFHGADRVIEDHYPYPHRFYDRHLFRRLREAGFGYEDFNEPGVGTLHYTVEDMRGNYLMQEVVPEWCRKVAENKLKKHGGKASFKLDWLAGRGLKPASPATGASPPKVIGGLKSAGKPVSDHDAIMVDVNIY